MNYSVPIRTQDWMIQSVYTTRDSRWKPVSLLLRMTSPWIKFEKKLFLGFSEVQNLFGFMIDWDDPEQSLKNQWLRIVESAVVIDDLDAVQEIE